jgi:TcpE family
MPSRPQRDEIDLPVYTSIFRLQRRLYRVYDVELPAPVSFPQVVAFVATGLVTVIALRLLGVELTPASAWVFVVPPVLAAWFANRRIADERTPAEWCAAQLRYLVEPRVLTSLARVHEPDRVKVTVKEWRPRVPRHAKRDEETAGG